MAKYKIGYVIGVLFCLGLLLTTLLSLTASAPNISEAQSPTRTPLAYDLPLIESLNALIADKECELPCWWGWQFGEENLSQVQIIADNSLGEPLFTSLDGEYIRLYRVLDGLMNWDLEYARTAATPRLKLWVNIESDQLVASHVTIDFPIASYVDFSPYLISEILSTYGVPDEVSLYAVSLASPLEMILKYDSLHYYLTYLLDYNFPLPLRLDSYKDPITLCNMPENIFSLTLSINLIPDEIDSPLTQFENIREFEGLSIDQISDLTAEEFTQIFSQPNKCFDTIPIGELDQKFREMGVKYTEK